jgi:hypothetical protein
MVPQILRRAVLALAFLALGLGARPVMAQGDPSFNVVNRSGRTITELYVSSAQVNSWGSDLLGSNVLAQGRSFPVRLPSGQCVNDIRVVYQGGQAEERRAIDTCPLNEVVFGNQQAQGDSKGGAAAAGRTGNPSFNLINRTGKTINVVHASPASSNSWGEDRLGSEVVPPGGTFPIRLPSGECTYDIRVEYADNSAEERRRVDLCEVSSVTFP